MKDDLIKEIIRILITSPIASVGAWLLSIFINFIKKKHQISKLNDELRSLYEICKRYECVLVISEKCFWRPGTDYYSDTGYQLVDINLNKINFETKSNCFDLLQQLNAFDLLKQCPYSDKIESAGSKFNGHKCYGLFKV